MERVLRGGSSPLGRIEKGLLSGPFLMQDPCVPRLPVEGDWMDRVVGLEGVRAQIAILQTPDGHGRLELTKFHTPSTDGGYQRAPANASGIRHVAFAVDDIDAVLARLRARGAELVGELGRYQDSYRLCYVRGPEGIIVELAEQIGRPVRPPPAASPALGGPPGRDPIRHTLRRAPDMSCARPTKRGYRCAETDRPACRQKRGSGDCFPCTSGSPTPRGSHCFCGGTATA